MNWHTAIWARRSRLLLGVLVALLGLVASCSGTGGSTGGSVAPSGPPNTIVIDRFAYQPVVLTVIPGAKVTVINQDPAAHTVTAKDKSFDTGSIAMGEQDEITAPSKPGSYPYYCRFHGYMTGTLIVK
jgi:plastocyanin